MTDARTDAATRETNKALIRRFVEEVQNQKSEEAYWELNDPEFVNSRLFRPASPPIARAAPEGNGPGRDNIGSGSRRLRRVDALDPLD